MNELKEEKYTYEDLIKNLQIVTNELEIEKSKRLKDKSKADKAQHNHKNELLKKRLLLDDMEQEKKERIRFFSLISHDLRSPIGTLSEFIELMIEDFNDLDKDTIKADLLRLQKMVSKLNLLTESLLKWTMHKLDKFECVWSIINLKEIVIKNVELVLESCKNKNIFLINKLLNPISFYADFDMIDAVIRNILSNAIKYSKANDSIEINAESKKDGIILSILDSGIGMKKARLDQLFSPLATDTLSYSGTEGEKGTGMGLLLCKELVEKCGGSINIKSNENQGTQVLIKLLPTPNKNI